MNIKGFGQFSDTQARLEMKNPLRKSIDKLFLSLSGTKIVLLGALAGALVPIALCLPFLLYLLAGFLYSSGAEALVPRITGFQGEAFGTIAGHNIRFFGGIMYQILKFTVLPSLLAGIFDISLRHALFRNPKSENLWTSLYTRFVVPALLFYVPLLVLTWSAREAMFGVAGLLCILTIPAIFLGFVYRCALLVTVDKLLQFVLVFRDLFSKNLTKKTMII